MKGAIKIIVDVDNEEQGAKIANLLQNIVDNVEVRDLISLNEKVEKRKTFFKEIIGVLDNPFFKKMFR